mmetsp:Transcript_45128/g.134765  ORF Transcript_45128/g.134765 Transcript_45128/m.134765 type:complete len:352 (+) Transcript_45128:2239-3294(+)
MRPSRPPIAWKKNSWGVRPRRYEFSTKPRDSGPKSSLVKCGSVRFWKPNGMRLPSTFCCPTQPIICEMLMNDPLEPADDIFTMLFVRSTEPSARLPASSRALFSTEFTRTSNASCIVRPGCASSSPAWYCPMIFFTSSLARSMISLIVVIVASSATVSPMPMLMPWCSSQWLMVCCMLLMNTRVASEPCSWKIVCTKPPSFAPSDFLHSVPVSSSPRRSSTCESSRLRPGGSASFHHDVLRVRLISGQKQVMTCLPVHSGRGLSTAGMGSVPSQPATFIMMFIMRSRSMNESRLVMRRAAHRVSCTMPMTGLFACGEMMLRGTIMSSRISARVSCVCATCMFISSPSKSAL